MVQKLIVVHYGNFDPRQTFSDGRRRVVDLAKKLVPLLADQRIAGFVSDMDVAVRTGEILSAHIPGLSFEQKPCFYSWGGALNREMAGNVMLNLSMVDNSCDAIVVVTHKELAKYLPEMWAKEHHFHIEDDIRRSVDLPHGSAWLVDAVTHKAQVLQSAY